METNGESRTAPRLAYVMRRKGRHMVAWYVAQLPGQGGKDWGWTTDPNSQNDPAIAITPYWQRRFRRDRLHCREVAYFKQPFIKELADANRTEADFQTGAEDHDPPDR